VKQKVTHGSVDFIDSGLNYAINKAVEDGRHMEMMFCWHSHVDFGAFWSGTDETMIKGMNNGMTPYLVSLVQNKMGEHEQRVDFFNPGGPLGKFKQQVRYNLDLYHEGKDAVPEHIQTAFDELVEVPSAKIPPAAGYGYGGLGEWDDYEVNSIMNGGGKQEPMKGRRESFSGKSARYINDNRSNQLQKRIEKVGYIGINQHEKNDLHILMDQLSTSTHIAEIVRTNDIDKLVVREITAPPDRQVHLMIGSDIECEVTEDMRTEGYHPVKASNMVTSYMDNAGGEVEVEEAIKYSDAMTEYKKSQKEVSK